MRTSQGLSVLLFLLLFASCAVQKRRYQPGFAFSRNKSVHHPVTVRAQPHKGRSIKKRAPVERPIEASTEPNEDPIIASNSEILAFKIKKANLFTHGQDTCDVFFYRDGTEEQVKVIDVNPKQTRYRRCDNPDGPVYIVENGKLFMIKYADGKRQTFEASLEQQKQTPTVNHALPTVRKTHPMAIASLICAIVGVIAPFLLIPAFIFAQSAIRQIEASPEKYKGRGLAVAGKTICITVTILYALLVIIPFILLLI